MVGRIRKRIAVMLEGELISDRGNYPAVITNISENGMYAKIPLSEREKNYTPDLNFSYLKLQLPAGDHLNLKCKKKWSHQIGSGSLIAHIGIELINPSQQYNKFIKTLAFRKFKWQ